MNGPEHYREAERLLGQVNEAQIVHVDRELSLAEIDELKARVEKLIGKPVVIAASGIRVDPSPALAAAQIHATLALAGATITASGKSGVYEGEAWRHVLEPR